jgi:DNA (cytosine-5)-methyltransferase 1
VRALDLFCGAGGASAGLVRAGFEVVGVDIAPMPEYPFEFVRGDACRPPVRLDRFDLIWASPPCQRYSFATGQGKAMGKEYPDLVASTRALLESSGRPYIIENVPPAPLRHPVALTGPMFGLRVLRRRHFEIGRFHAEQPRIPKPFGTASAGDFEVICGGGNQRNYKSEKRLRRKSNLVDPARRSRWGRRDEWVSAMGIDWMTMPRMAQAIPPAYSEYLAREFLRTGGCT